jgi:hypothetical protein
MNPTDSSPSFGVVKAPLTPAPNVTNWSLLKDTYWIVVSKYTPAYELQGNSLGTIGLPKTDPPTITRILDQTVYYIQDVDPLGYLWGYVGVTLVDPSWDKGSHPQTTYGTLLSPITPAGDWILSTTVNQGNTALQEPSQTWATGKMAWMNVDGVDQWTMENWKVGGYVHWAYMIQSKPGDEYWDSLPVTNQSIPEFLAPAKASWEPVNPVPYSVFDANPPQISSITTEGKTVILEFKEAVQARYVLSSAFTVATVSSTKVITSIAVSSASLNPNNLSQVILTLAGAAPASTVDLRVSYTDPVGNQTSGVIQDLKGNDAASFSMYADKYVASSTSKIASKYHSLTLAGTATINGTGNNLDNTIAGNAGNNILNGGAGADTLIGGGGNDSLIGGKRRDTLSGSSGVDRFVYWSIADSGIGSASRDVITDFRGISGEKIDLSAIDAFSKAPGNQVFAFIGLKAFTGSRGEARFSKGILQLNTGTDKVADMEIALTGINSFSQNFLIL